MAITPAEYLAKSSKDLKFLVTEKRSKAGYALIPLIIAGCILFLIFKTAPLGSYWPLDAMALFMPITFFATLLVITKTTKKVRSNSNSDD
jgi:hypothetical protein